MIGNGFRGGHGVREDGLGRGYGFWGETGPGGGFQTDSHGTDGDDIFTGTDADEHYEGLGGNDMIGGGGGRDHLSGDDGDDMIDGNGGNDHLSGGIGKDSIHGNSGDDVIDGGGDHDRLFGGSGDDIVSGGGGDDVIKFGPGNDVARGGEGNDYIQPQSNDGGDKLYGGDGDDIIADAFSSLYGGAGDDDLSGEGSLMKGGAGDDILRINASFVQDDHSHEVSGGSGADTFIYNTGNGDISGGSEAIHDLASQDIVDLSQIDAQPVRNGDQAFTLVSQFDGHAGEMTVTYDAQQDRTLIKLYTNTDSTPDGTIWTPGDHADFSNFVF